MKGNICLITANEKFSFFHIYEYTNEKSIPSYKDLLNDFIQKFPENIKINEKIAQRKTEIFKLSPYLLYSKTKIVEIDSKPNFNEQLLVKFDFGYQTQSQPLLSENEAIQCIDNAKNVYNQSICFALKFYSYSSNFDLYDYAIMLYKHKKWNTLNDMTDLLLQMYPKDSKISLICAKTCEVFHDTEKAFQIYRNAFQFSDAPDVLVEWIKLYSNTEHQFSSLLLSHALRSYSTDPNVIIQSMKSFIQIKKFPEAINAAFRNEKSISFLAKSLPKNEEFSNFFIAFYSNISISVQESVNLATIFYKKGAVLEALYVCRRCAEDSNFDPFIMQTYFTILINEGLYRTFSKISGSFSNFMANDNDVNKLQLNDFFLVFFSLTECKKKSTDTNLTFSPFHQQVEQLTKRQSAIIDCCCAMLSFLFLIGVDFHFAFFEYIDSYIVKLDNIKQFNFIEMESSLKSTSDALRTANWTRNSALLIGDESCIIGSYRKFCINKASLYAIPRVIIKLSIWKLRRNQNNGQKESFWSCIASIDEYSSIILELGEVDCEYEIPRLMQKNRFSSVSEAIDEITNIYFRVISKIQNKYPNLQIIIHPIIPRSSASSALVYGLNEQIFKKANESNISFLGIFNTLGPLDTVNSNQSWGKYINLILKSSE